MRPYSHLCSIAPTFSRWTCTSVRALAMRLSRPFSPSLTPYGSSVSPGAISLTTPPFCPCRAITSASTSVFLTLPPAPGLRTEPSTGLSPPPRGCEISSLRNAPTSRMRQCIPSHAWAGIYTSSTWVIAGTSRTKV